MIKKILSRIPVHCDSTFARAMPSDFMLRKLINPRLKRMFSTLMEIMRIMGVRAFCIPMNHPVRANMISVAGEA